MTVTQRSANSAQSMLDGLIETFELYQRYDALPRMTEEDYAKFIIENPQHVDPVYRIAATTFAESRFAVEGLSIPRQQLAGALIRTCFSNEQLEQMGNN